MIIPLVPAECPGPSLQCSPSLVSPTSSSSPASNVTANLNASNAPADSWTKEVTIITFIVMLACMILTSILLIYLHIRSRRITLVPAEKKKAQEDGMKMSAAMPFLVGSSFALRQKIKDCLDFRSSSLWLLTSKSSFRNSLNSEVSSSSSDLGDKTVCRLRVIIIVVFCEIDVCCEKSVKESYLNPRSSYHSDKSGTSSTLTVPVPTPTPTSIRRVPPPRLSVGKAKSSLFLQDN